MKTNLAFALLLFLVGGPLAGSTQAMPQGFSLFGDVAVTIDAPSATRPENETLVILYALPNGSTTAQTRGKKITDSDDWRFDSQHIGAQTAFLRRELPDKNIAVVYLENAYKSWPQWKAKHANAAAEVQAVVDSVFNCFRGRKTLYLNGHSGGGRFIFTYLDGVEVIPPCVKNISFLDSDYGYEKTYLPKLLHWLQANKDAHLNVFAYNDSVALLNGKPFVSDTGGTWYRSGLLLRHLMQTMSFKRLRNDSLIVYQSLNGQVGFYLKTNPEKKIYHTQQVERNGFIHSLLAGTKKAEKRYTYFGERAYEELLE